jgi:hypothetical protein
MNGSELCGHTSIRAVGRKTNTFHIRFEVFTTVTMKNVVF